MKCPACEVETGKRAASYFCPHCGAPLAWAMRWENARRRARRQEVREKLAVSPVRIAPQILPACPGALLTGNTRGDFFLGVLNEPVAVTLIAFAAWQLLSAPMDDYPMLTVLAQIATGAFMLWHGARMRERFPTVASGFQRWRTVTGWCGDHLKTLICGAIMAMILFPLAAIFLFFVQMFGMIGWIPILIVVYGFGVIARRIRGDQPKRKQRLQNG